MEILSPSCFLSNISWPGGRWTPAENKAFENALALFDENTPDRWQKVAAMVPTKTVLDVIRQYKELEDDVTSIEAGLVPIPGYSSYNAATAAAAATPSPHFKLDWGGPHRSYRHYYHGSGFKHSLCVRKSFGHMPTEQERKKGVPWTEEEHKLFLMGLKKYGKGDWRNISRNFVITRTPTQVASHAQKYFIRQLSGGKDKRRASIHDITTVNLDENWSSLLPDNNKPLSSVGFQTSKETTTYKEIFGNGRNVFATHGLTSPYMLESHDSVFQVNAEGFHYLDA